MEKAAQKDSKSKPARRRDGKNQKSKKQKKKTCREDKQRVKSLPVGRKKLSKRQRNSGKHLVPMTQLLQSALLTIQYSTVSCAQSSTMTLRLRHGSNAEYARAGVMKHVQLEKGALGLSMIFVSE